MTISGRHMHWKVPSNKDAHTQINNMKRRHVPIEAYMAGLFICSTLAACKPSIQLSTKTPEPPPVVATPPAITGGSALVAPFVIRGVFEVVQTTFRGDEVLGIWVFTAEGEITAYLFATAKDVVLRNGSYTIQKAVDTNNLRLTLACGPFIGEGQIEMLPKNGDDAPKGFKFQSDELKLAFHSHDAKEFRSMLDTITGRVDFRENKHKDWRAIGDGPNIIGRLPK